MKQVVRCSCGTEVRGANEAELIVKVKEHASSAHDLTLTDDQIRDMIEIEPE